MAEEPVRLMVQLKSTPALAATAFGPVAAAPEVTPALPGFQVDPGYSPVPILPPAPAGAVAGAAALADSSILPTYVVRGVVAPDAVNEFIGQATANPDVVGVFSDPRIAPTPQVCGRDPARGTDADVEASLALSHLRQRGLDGSGVRVAVVDGGVNMAFLNRKGKTPGLDSGLSWAPPTALFRIPGAGPLPEDDSPIPQQRRGYGHGTMCAYDVCIAAPRCVLVDHSVLLTQAPQFPGSSIMEGLLSDAVASYGVLLSHMLRAGGGESLPRTLVVTNSWGMFHPGWDFPVGTPQNYSKNMAHPFNLVVASLERQGADILFAAGNCGDVCPDGRCRFPPPVGSLVTNVIFGANSHPSVLCVAGADFTGQLAGYSTRGPGLLDPNKPDITCFTHFRGSEVFGPGGPDSGTSAATPVMAGVVAAIRERFPASKVRPARLRELIRETANPAPTGTQHMFGAGIVDAPKLVARLESEFGAVAGLSMAGPVAVRVEDAPPGAAAKVKTRSKRTGTKRAATKKPTA